MPNHVRSIIEIKAPQERVEQVLEQVSTYHPPEPRTGLDGSTVFVHKDNTGDWTTDKVGWWNEEKKEFSTRLEGVGSEVVVIGNEVPDDYELDLTEAVTQYFDFNKIIPQPENLFNGNLGAKEREMCKEQGIPNWYDWNIQNWDTKWNSYDHVQHSDNIFEFSTAWSAPFAIFEKLAEMFPDVEFKIKYADEDTGYNCGVVLIMDGECYINEYDGGSKKAYELAFELGGYEYNSELNLYQWSDDYPEGFRWNDETETYDWVEVNEEGEV